MKDTIIDVYESNGNNHLVTEDWPFDVLPQIGDTLYVLKHRYAKVVGVEFCLSNASIEIRAHQIEE